MKIFISHSSIDNELVRKIIDVLGKYQVKYWVDFKQLKKGDDFIRDINKELDNSDLFLLIWTANAKGSWWVNAEIAASTEHGDNLRKIVIKLDDTPVQLPMAQFLRPNIKKDSLQTGVEGLLLELADFPSQIELFRKTVKQHYENRPEPPARPIIANFKKFDGGEYYVQQRYKNMSNQEEGGQVVEYILRSIAGNFQAIQAEKEYHNQIKLAEEKIEALNLDKDIVSELKRGSSVVEIANAKKPLAPETATIILGEKQARTAVNSARTQLAKVKSARKELEKLGDYKAKIASLEEEYKKLEDPRFVLKATEPQILARNQRMSEIMSEKYELHARWAEISFTELSFQELTSIQLI